MTRQLSKRVGLSALAVASIVAPVVQPRLGAEVESHSSATSAASPIKYALVVGVDSYLDPSLQVSASADVARNAVVVGETLEEKGYRVQTLHDQSATRTRIVTAISRLAFEAKSDDVVLLYLSGAAVQNGTDQRVYWLPYDTSLNLLESDAIRFDHLYDLIETIPARQKLVLLDGVFIGKVLRTGFSEARSRFEFEVSDSEDPSVGKGIDERLSAFLVASLRRAAVSDRRVRSLTSLMLDALQGSADSDRDGNVSVQELATFVQSVLGTPQTSNLGLFVIRGNQDWIVAKAAGGEEPNRMAAHRATLSEWRSRGWLPLTAFLKATALLENSKTVGTGASRVKQLDQMLQILEAPARGLSQARALETLLTAQKRALVIGIDEYVAAPRIRGARNDAQLMARVLVEKFEFTPGQVRVLLDREATRSNLIKAIAELTSSTSAGDTVVLYFAGHGSRIADVSGDETDGFDETILAQDSQPGESVITDDELSTLMDGLAARTDNAIFIVDAVHAAGLADWTSSSGSVLFLAACAETELSYESQGDQGVPHGAFTLALAEALAKTGQDSTYRSLMDRVMVQVSSRFPSQHPVAIGPGLDRPIFDRFAEITESPYVLVTSVAGGRVRLNEGSLQGVTPGSRYAVHPPGTRSFAAVEPKAVIEVIQVRALESDAIVKSGSAIEPNSRAVEISHNYADSALRLRFEASANAPVLEQIRKQLQPFQHIQVNGDDRADFVLRVNEGQVQLASPSLASSVTPTRGQAIANETPLATVPLADPEVVSKTVKLVKQWARWHNLFGITNYQSALRVRMEVKGSELKSTQPGELPKILAGSEFEVAVTNASLQPLYIALLDLSWDGAVTLLHPTVGADGLLPSGQSVTVRLRGTLPPRRDSEIDVLKAFATTEPVDFGILVAPAVTRGTELGPSDRGGPNALEQLLASAASGTSRAANARNVRVHDWTTAVFTIEVVSSLASNRAQPKEIRK